MHTFHYKCNPFSLYSLVMGNTLYERMWFALFLFYANFVQMLPQRPVSACKEPTTFWD